MAPKASPQDDDPRPYRLSDALVSEVKAEMGRQDITPAALARLIGQSKQYVSSRLTTGNPHTGKRVPLLITDIGAIASALGLNPLELVDRAQSAADVTDWD